MDVASKDLFLDFGGTLVESVRYPYPVFRAVLADHGIDLERRDFDRGWAGLPKEDAASAHAYLGRTDEYWRQWDGRVLGSLGIPDVEGILGDALRHAFVDPRWQAPYPETESVLRELQREGYRLHLVSNHTEDLRGIVANLGWTDLFASLTFSQEVGAEKPDPRVFRLALRRAGAEPHAVCHVGDSWTADVEGAWRSGLRPIWVNRDQEVAPAPVPTIVDLRGLVGLLEAL